jgi:integrase
MAVKPRTWPRIAHGDGTWSYDAGRSKIELRHLVDGKRYVERGETTDECIAKRNRRRRDIADLQGLANAGSSLDRMVDEWMAFDGRGKSPQTIGGYRWSMEHVKRHLGHLEATEVGLRDLETMYVALIDGGMSAASLVKLRSNLKMAFDYGIRHGFVSETSATLVRRSKMPGGAQRSRSKLWFNLSEYETVRQHLVVDRSVRHSLMLSILLAGLRPGEALGLKWDHVDIPGAVLRVEGQIQRPRIGVPATYSTDLKTDRHGDHAHREVPIAGDLKLVLAELQRTADSEFVFSEWGSHVPINALQDTARAIAADAGVRYVNPNGYRHTFASVCRHHGMPYEQLAKIMGHADASMIIQTYGHPLVAPTAVDLDRYVGSVEM